MVAIFPIDEEKIVLAMKKRGHGEGRWNSMGGKVEPSKTIEQAAVREAREEVGIKITSSEKRAELIFDERHKGKREQICVHVFVAKSWGSEPIETEKMAPRWFSAADIPYDHMWQDDKYWLPEILAGKKLKGNFSLDDNDNINEYSLTEVENFET